MRKETAKTPYMALIEVLKSFPKPQALEGLGAEGFGISGAWVVGLGFRVER